MWSCVSRALFIYNIESPHAAVTFTNQNNAIIALNPNFSTINESDIVINVK